MASSINIKRPGLLHKKLGVPQGQKIPASKLAAAKNSSSPSMRKEATFAQNFGHKIPSKHKSAARARSKSGGKDPSGY